VRSEGACLPHSKHTHVSEMIPRDHTVDESYLYLFSDFVPTNLFTHVSLPIELI
jgi:hypothetical protein